MHASFRRPSVGGCEESRKPLKGGNDQIKKSSIPWNTCQQASTKKLTTSLLATRLLKSKEVGRRLVVDQSARCEDAAGVKGKAGARGRAGNDESVEPSGGIRRKGSKASGKKKDKVRSVI